MCDRGRNSCSLWERNDYLWSSHLIHSLCPLTSLLTLYTYTPTTHTHRLSDGFIHRKHMNVCSYLLSHTLSLRPTVNLRNESKEGNLFILAHCSVFFKERLWLKRQMEGQIKEVLVICNNKDSELPSYFRLKCMLEYMIMSLQPISVSLLSFAMVLTRHER